MKVPNKTNAFIRFLKPLLPLDFRVRLRKIHQKSVFQNAIKNFNEHYEDIENYPGIVNDLIYGWGNMGWSSFQDYTYAIIKAAKENSGPVLECGSGLSTLLLGIIGDRRGFEVWTLEHEPNWAEHVGKHLAQLNIKSVTVCSAPLKQYDGFRWYNTDEIKSSAPFSLVICDGPPHYSERQGLLPVMSNFLEDKALILLDDYVIPEEKAIASTPVERTVNEIQFPKEESKNTITSVQPIKPLSIEEKFVTRKKIFATEIPVSGDSIELHFYDNAQIDGDSISLFLNDKLIFEHIKLTEKAYSVKLPVTELNASNELIMVAENLGSIPPNTSYMVALVGEKRYEARLESTEGSSALIRLVKKVDR